jgi:hypothetical protein
MCWNAIAINARAAVKLLIKRHSTLTTLFPLQKVEPMTSATCIRFAKAVT